jgi:hypothetical protein
MWNLISSLFLFVHLATRGHIGGGGVWILGYTIAALSSGSLPPGSSAQVGGDFYSPLTAPSYFPTISRSMYL